METSVRNKRIRKPSRKAARDKDADAASDRSSQKKHNPKKARVARQSSPDENATPVQDESEHGSSTSSSDEETPPAISPDTRALSCV